MLDKSKFKQFFIVILGPLFSGCAAVAISGNYPDEWPALTEKIEGCPNISGTYLSDGRSGYKNTIVHDVFHPVINPDMSPNLTPILLGQEGLNNYAIEITQPDANRLIVTANFHGNAAAQAPGFVPLSKTYFFDKKNFLCDDGMTWISTSAAPVLAPTDMWNKIGFRKATDGSLVGKKIEGSLLDPRKTTFMLWLPHDMESVVSE